MLSLQTAGKSLLRYDSEGLIPQSPGMLRRIDAALISAAAAALQTQLLFLQLLPHQGSPL